MEHNPLKQYFRQPAIYIKLPSGGNFYEGQSLERTANSEYPVMPMTTMDEITYRTPDALFNGSAVPTVIQSCVPNIKNAWSMPVSDIDTVLVAIRIATYGHTMEISTHCPKCGHEDNYDLDLRVVMENIKSPDYQKTLSLGDLELHFCPMTYQQINDNNMRQFEDQKIMQVVQDSDIADEEKMAKLGAVLKKITQFTSEALAQNIAMVITPQSRVIDHQHITDWLLNCDRAVYMKVRDHIIEIKQQAELKPLNITCRNCSNEYEQNYTLDMSNFFEAAS